MLYPAAGEFGKTFGSLHWAMFWIEGEDVCLKLCSSDRSLAIFSTLRHDLVHKKERGNDFGKIHVGCLLLWWWDVLMLGVPINHANRDTEQILLTNRKHHFFGLGNAQFFDYDVIVVQELQ